MTENKDDILSQWGAEAKSVVAACKLPIEELEQLLKKK